MSKTETAKTDRRREKRVVAPLPVKVRDRSGSLDPAAQTRDVSTNGVFLYTQSRMVEGSEVELVLMLPEELTSGKKCWVCCHAQVLRVEGDGKDFGVAAEIRRIDVLPEIPL
ncbi:MAG: PilZ domain-containing protein [Candidatus Sulfotelmatobacter sp.]